MPPRKKAAATASTSGNAGKISPSHANISDEQIMAYLRIRPHLGDNRNDATPYLSHLSDKSVRMTDPSHSDLQGAARYRPSTVPPTSTYTFSHIFPPDTNQSDFFNKTTLPLVQDVLNGQNSLLFAYGATNSGKTYSVQGGKDKGSAGIIPRTMDVVFNSIKGLHGDGKYRPARLYAVEPSDLSDSMTKIPKLALPIADSALAQVLGQDLDQATTSNSDIDPTVLKLDRNYEYTVYISYAEVYNEKIYDLLASVKNATSANANPSGIPTPSSNPNMLLMRKALPLKSSPPADFPADSGVSVGKYIAGLRQFRVNSAAQAKELVKLGQLHRRVFGTLANKESSRSHGIVIIKIMRCHRGEKNDPTAIQVSRLTLIDLAGSERTKHTQTTGDRLREAGNINKSLMVLGQCLEVMRSNQRKLATTLGATEGRMDTRDVKRGLAVIPFRHSKLTELLMDYFVGDGRAVMIVNVNPYDTGYDENSHVMKFAALAREIYITPTPAPVQRIPPSAPAKGSKQGPLKLRGSDIAPRPFTRKVTISSIGIGRKDNEAVVEVLEEDEGEQEEVDSDLEGANPLIDTLFEEIESLRLQLFETEMRCAIIEADTREEVMQEMEERMRKMEKMYADRFMRQVEDHERKMDAKIDMLHRSGLLGSSPVKQGSGFEDDEDDDYDGDEQDIELSLINEGPSDTNSEMNEPKNPARSQDTRKSRERQSQRRISVFLSDGEEVPRLPDELDEEEEGSDDDVTEASTVASTDNDTSSEYEDADEQEDEEEEWEPSSIAPTPKPKKIAPATPPKPVPKQPARKGKQKTAEATTAQAPARRTTRATRGSTAVLEEKMAGLTVKEKHSDDAAVPIKKSRAKKSQPEPAKDVLDSDFEEEVKPHTAKKKRQLGKNRVVTEEELQKVTLDTEAGVRRNIPRMMRSGKR